MRFIQIDRVEELRLGESIRAVKCITLADDVFDEHFPGLPVYPGSLVLEAMAQAGGLLILSTIKNEGGSLRKCLLVMANRLKFKVPVLPGDKLVVKASISSRLDSSILINASAEVDGEIRASGELTFGLGEPLSEPTGTRLLELFGPCFPAKMQSR